jgi:anti-sigma B factor antagonist
VDLTIEIAPGLQRVTVWLAGEVDLACRGHLHDVLEALLSEPRDITVNLREVTFVDSTGINAFVGAHRHCHQLGHTFVLAQPQPAVRRVLELTGVDTILLALPSTPVSC